MSPLAWVFFFAVAVLCPILGVAAIHYSVRAWRMEAIVQNYAGHQSWRCEYRSRYKVCCCGLDDALVMVGLVPDEIAPVSDPDRLS